MNVKKLKNVLFFLKTLLFIISVILFSKNIYSVIISISLYIFIKYISKTIKRECSYVN